MIQSGSGPQHIVLARPGLVNTGLDNPRAAIMQAARRLLNARSFRFSRTQPYERGIPDKIDGIYIERVLNIYNRGVL